MQELLRHLPDGSKVSSGEMQPAQGWRQRLRDQVLEHLPKSKRLRKFAAPLILGASAAFYGGAVCSGEDTPKASELQPHLTYSLTLPFAAGETWWYTGGPHSDGLSKGVRYGVDFSPSPNAISCKDGKPHVYTEKYVRTIADGTVIHAGNPNDPKDKYHSIVEIDHGNGLVESDMHLSEIQVMVGQKVKQGDPLGYASCEVPPGGETDGVHVHTDAVLNGKPIEIDRLVLSGWEIRKTSGNYQGTMTKSGEDIRTADTRRCGPSAASIKACGGARNDVEWGALAETVPTMALKPTIAPVETVELPTLVPIENPNRQNEGVLDFMGWQFRIGSWESPVTTYQPASGVVREGWRRLVLKGDIVNMQSVPADPGNPYGIYYYINGGNANAFFVMVHGNKYPLHIGQLMVGNVYWSGTNVVSFEHGQLGQNQSEPFVAVADIPEAFLNEDYEIAVFDRKGQRIGPTIEKGEVYHPGAGESGILPGVEKHDTSEVWNIPGYAKIGFGGVSNFKAERSIEEYVALNIENDSGNDINLRFAKGANYDLKVYLRDGRVIEGWDMNNGGYSGELHYKSVVPPGATEKLNVKIAGGAEKDMVDTTGAVVVFSIMGGPLGTQIHYWQLP